MNIYTDLTNEFNKGKLRAIISSGQAVVLHHLAIMSKDGDWIVREDEETIHHVLTVLDKKKAKYRFGAPFDPRWMAGGWSSHFEFMQNGLRIRTDFVTRPPRISPERLAKIWVEQEGCELPVVGLADLVELKKTNREKDYAVIGEIARTLTGIDDRLRCSRSAREILELALKHPALLEKLANERPLLSAIHKGEAYLEQELDAERRRLIHANEDRLGVYLDASAKWAECWKKVESEIDGLSLLEAHRVIVEKSASLLPVDPFAGKRA